MESYYREILDAPARIAQGGRCVMGTFNQPIETINLLDLDRPLGRRLPRFANYMRLKEWQAFQISSEDWFICIAVYNSKALGIAIIMAFNKAEGKMYRYERKVPFWKLKVPSGLSDSLCYYKSRLLSIEIHNHLKAGRFEISFKAKGFKELPDCRARFTAYHSTEPIVIVQPFDDNRPLYSHKALMPAAGTFFLGDKTYEFPKGQSAIILDDHKGFYPYEMKYDWVTAMGYTGNVLTGFNLTDNQILNHEKYNENCLWLDGKMVPLPPIKVNRPGGVENTWEIKDRRGRVDLRFTPIQDVPVYINLVFAATQYHGPTGRFEGYILDHEDNEISFDGFTGMGEQKIIRM